jgi:hypothetical protein
MAGSLADRPAPAPSGQYDGAWLGDKVSFCVTNGRITSLAIMVTFEWRGDA